MSDAPPDTFRVLFRGAAIPTAVVGGVAMAAALLLGRGAGGAAAAALGCLVVIGFFGMSLLVMRWTADSHPVNALGAAMVSYTIKIVALGLVFVLLRQVESFDQQAFGLTVLACALVWLGFEVRAFTRAQLPTVAPQPPLPGPPDQGA
jgi:ATP synthase protein I